jgi:hypothetical protein
MLKTIYLSAALFLTTTSGAWAGESEPDPNAVPPSAAQVAPLPEAAMPAPTPVPPAPSEQVAALSAPAPSVPAEPSVPEPYTGWGRGQRAPIYINLMMAVGAYGEDGDNRLTTRDSKVLEGFGGVLRIGAVLDRHHRIGGRLQSFVRPTKKVILDPPATATTTDEWGVVTFGFAGPEYIYTTDFGLYAGGSIGIGGAMSASKFDDDDDKSDHLERGSAGIAGIASLGYEWRANKWFAMNAEIYGGLYRGIDDNENGMNGGLFGLAMGVGF